MLKKLKQLFNYRRLWKHQKNKNKYLKKKINKLSKGISEEIGLDVTNEEIRKLKIQVTRYKNRVRKLELECQRYFDMLMEQVNK